MRVPQGAHSRAGKAYAASATTADTRAKEAHASTDAATDACSSYACAQVRVQG